MELAKKNIHMEREKSHAVSQATLEDDINISDTKADAKEIVLNKGHIKLDEVKPGVDLVTLKGALHFNVLYCSDANPSKVLNLDGKIPFEENINMERILPSDNITVRADVEDLSVSLINSRKLNIRSLINFTLGAPEIFDTQAAYDITDGANVEFCKKNLSFAQIALRQKDVYRIKEELSLPQNLPNILSPIWHSVALGEIDFKPLADKIAVNGELKAFVLYEGEGEATPIQWFDSTIPFNGALDVNGVKEHMICDITYSLQNVDIEVRPDYDGEERTIGLDVNLDLGMKLYEEENIEILDDVYGTKEELIPVTEPSTYKKLLVRNTGKVKIADRITAKESDLKLLQVCHYEGKAIIDTYKIGENTLEASGVIKVKVLYVTNDDLRPFMALEEEIPFACVLDAPGIKPDSEVKLEGCLENLSVAIIDGTQLDVKAAVAINSIVFSNHTADLITDITKRELSSEKINALPGIVAFIAKEGDSLWDIGKEYYIPIAKILETNNMASDVVTQGQHVLVVR